MGTCVWGCFNYVTIMYRFLKRQTVTVVKRFRDIDLVDGRHRRSSMSSITTRRHQKASHDVTSLRVNAANVKLSSAFKTIVVYSCFK